LCTEEKIDDKHSGFGLANVNKRLALLYAGEHELEIEDSETEYTVNLRLKIK
jgi:sensor histidine kinase YesM